MKPSKTDKENPAIQEFKSPAYSDEDNARIDRTVKRARKLPPRYGYDGERININFDNDDKLLNTVNMFEHFGTVSQELQHALLNQAAGSFRGFNEDTIKAVESACNVAVAFLNGIQPQNEIEGLMAVQMLAVHNVAMDALRMAMIDGQTFEGRKANINHAVKLVRTFNQQTEVLKRYRTGGQQKVTVEHVHVDKGAQAVVGTVNVHQGGGGEE